MPKFLHQRLCAETDEPFLRRLYASTREWELALVDWSESQKQAFLQMQFEVQSSSYRAQFPGAEWYVILGDEAPIGRLIIERREDELALIDIAMLPEHRGQGIGSLLIQQLMAEAGRLKLPLRLHVEKDNAGALRLYRRLGFEVIGVGGLHLWMESSAPGTGEV